MDTLSILIAAQTEILLAGTHALLSPEQDMAIVGNAADRKALIQLLEKETPDVLLFGLLLPKEEVIGLLKDISRRNPATRTLVFMEQTEGADLEAILRAGAKGILPTHVPAATLKRAVRAVAGGEYWVDRKTVGKLFSEFLQMRHPAKAPRGAADSLTNRETEVLKLLSQGCKNKEIAQRLFISVKTVKTHLTNIFAKLKIKDRLQAALYGIENHPKD
jgi:two-component system, NarL family, response regulator LiaR